MLQIRFILFFVFFSVICCFSQDDGDYITKRVEKYRERYGVECLEEKITDNQGLGNEKLYGTRNFRTILYGVAYRGGANNYFHKLNKRNNKNPLPEDGLQNLLTNGFSTSVYLYDENFEKDTFYINTNNDTLNYIQIGGNTSEEVDKILSLTYKSITNSEFGPIYLHCWNGWHQSGYISAILLKQFCDFSSQKSIHYWEDCADNWIRGYATIREKIKEFKPLDKYKINKKTRDLICPCYTDKREMDSLKEQSLKILNLSIEFMHNYSDLPPGVTTFLDAYARMLRNNSSVIIEIGGHTDCTGSKDYNLMLSKQRALNVYNYLLQQNVNPTQLTYKGYGEDNLLAPCEGFCNNKNNECHNQNRRIEFKIQSVSCHINFIKNDYLIMNAKDSLQLNDISNILFSDSDIIIEIQGHTCSDGSDFVNNNLSRLRAEEVYNYLQKKGLNMKNISYKGYGSTIPISSNDTEEGKKINRRIEFKMIEKE